MKRTNKFRRKMIYCLAILGVIIIASVIVLLHPAWGGSPAGVRMERMRRSPNYADGKFQNLEPTDVMTSEGNIFQSLWKSLFPGIKDLKPSEALPSVKTDLLTLDTDYDQIIWFGHSSYLLVMGGKKVLVDPVLTSSFPANLMMKPFAGTDVYSPEDLPPIEILLITHDHYDHLDYGTVKAIRNRVKRVVCPLGVGAHFERWGYHPQQIVELDWNERRTFGGVNITCLPARHFSGRFITRNNTLWASYMLQSPGLKLYVAGDGGYGNHFKEIARRNRDIDVAILEVGQYDADWRQIHVMPQEEDSVIRDLNPSAVIPVHNGKFALARHSWREPTETMRNIAESDTTFTLIQPIIGKSIPLRHQ